MSEQLIVDFPARRRSQALRSVGFDDFVEIYPIGRNYDNVNHWYNNSDYSVMKLAKKKEIVKGRVLMSGADPLRYSTINCSNDYCLIGIEHHLTRATASEYVACRRRCVQAVLQEQARQKKMNSFAISKHGQDSQWNDIANASSLESKTAVMRAQQKANIVRNSISI